MNWLIYIGGFLLGIALLGRLFTTTSNDAILIIDVSWIMTWVWICLKFIK